MGPRIQPDGGGGGEDCQYLDSLPSSDIVGGFKQLRVIFGKELSRKNIQHTESEQEQNSLQKLHAQPFDRENNII